jgi:hypothetical protein
LLNLMLIKMAISVRNGISMLTISSLKKNRLLTIKYKRILKKLLKKLKVFIFLMTR